MFFKKYKKNLGRNLFIFLGLLPALVWMYFFAVYPIAVSAVRSFSDWKLSSLSINFTGFKNYISLFTDMAFIATLKNTLFAVAFSTPPILALSLLAAVGFNVVSQKARDWYMPIYFLPTITSAIAVAAVWQWLYYPAFGFFNYLLTCLGLPNQPFLQSPSQALICVLVMIVWQQIGYYAVIFLAALKGIPTTFYEAASVDGATGYYQFWKITIPLLVPNILFVTILTVIATFQVFAPIQVMTNGGPGYASMVLAHFIYVNGIVKLDMGYASAASMILFLIIMVITLIQWKFIKNDWEY